MKLTVLSVAYPLAPVRPDTAGGAEQVLGMLDRALTAAGHHSIVIASEDSQVAGTLVPVPHFSGALDDDVLGRAHRNHRAALVDALSTWPADVVHLHGQDFDGYLPPPGMPVVATLHCPRQWYKFDPLAFERPDTHFVCVSQTQRRTWPEHAGMSVIENGVEIPEKLPARRKRNFAVALGRIAPDKGLHLALDAARRARVPLFLAGQVFRYAAHEEYFAAEIAPRLGNGAAKLLGPIGSARKRRLLSAARCVLIPSLIAETSSLVAMEALACRTPVIAFPSGALAEIVEHGRTGYLVRDDREMAEAIAAADEIDPGECRRAAIERFPAERTAREYLDLYSRLASSRQSLTRHA